MRTWSNLFGGANGGGRRSLPDSDAWCPPPSLTSALALRPVKPYILTAIFLAGASLLLISCGGPRNQATNITQPPDYTEQGLREAAQKRGVTPQDLPSIVNALASTPEMQAWARLLTNGATNDLQKARMLFDALLTHASERPSQFTRPPTAEEVFKAWNTPGSSFRCQEFAFLYASLARAVGLKAYYVDVTEDCRGIKVAHGCAAVFIAGRPIFVDLTYSSFDITHRKFSVLSDVETAGVYLSGVADLRLCQLASKLAPNLPAVHGALIAALLRADQLPEAQSELSRLVRLDPLGPDTYALRALLALRYGKTEEAQQLLRTAVDLAPETSNFRYLLGNSYAGSGNWAEAQKCYQEAARLAVNEEAEKLAQAAIACVQGEESLATQHWQDALASYDKAVGLTPDYFVAYFGRARARQMLGDLDGAATDCEKVIQLKPGMAEAYFARASTRWRKGDLDGALADCTKCLSLNPTIPFTYAMLGDLLYDHHQFPQALDALRKATQADPLDFYLRFRMFLTQSRLGRLTEASSDLEEFLRSGKADKTKEWQLKIAEFLLGHLVERDLLQAAETPDKLTTSSQKRCEACFYAGTMRLLARDEATAVNYFEKCVATGETPLIEYGSAKTELGFLHTATNAP